MLVLLAQLLIFLLASIVSFVVPGLLLVSVLKLKFDSITKFFLSTSIGILIFTLISYVLFYLNAQILTLPVLLITNIIYFLKIKPEIKFPTIDPVLIPLIIMSVVFALSMLTTGFRDGLLLARRDDYWHLPLIQELIYNFPPNFPSYSNLELKGYYFFYNLLIASLSRTFYLDFGFLHFYFVSFLNSVLWALGVYSLVFLITKHKLTSVFAVFMSMFAGSLAIVANLMGHNLVNFDDGLGLTQPIISLQNPPLAISIIFMLSFLILTYSYYKKINFSYLVPLILIIGLMPMFKVYGAIVVYSGFAVMVLIELYKKRFKILYIISGSFLVFAGTFFQFIGGTASLIYYPLWSTKKAFYENMPSLNYEEKFRTYYAQKVTRQILYYEAITIIVFIVGNLSTRLIGLIFLIYSYIKNPTRLSPFTAIFLTMVISSFMIPMLFIQSFQVFETIQFYQYFILLISILSSIGFGVFFKSKTKNYLKIIIMTLILLLTIPTFILRVMNYPNAQKEDLTNSFNTSMSYLADQNRHNDVFLIMPPKEVGINRGLIEKWSTESIPVAYFRANMQPFLAQQYNPYPELDTRRRIDVLIDLIELDTFDPNVRSFDQKKNKVIKHLKKEKINYIYSPYRLSMDDKLNEIDQVFSVEENYIYKVNIN